MTKHLAISGLRRGMAAMLRYVRQIPTIPVARTMRLGDLARRRALLTSPPSWSALFIRAYGEVCAAYPALRRAWISWPTPHLYEHPHSVCAVAVEREWQGEMGVLYSTIREPEACSVETLQGHLEHLKTAEVWSVPRYRAAIRFGRLPGLLQRFFLWSKLDWSGPRRVKYFGTFGMTNYGMHGAESLHPLGPQTTVLTLGPLGPDHEMTVKLVYDHRVLDGAFVARCLRELEEVVHTVLPGQLGQEYPRAA